MGKKNSERKVRQPIKEYVQVMFEGGRRELAAAERLMKIGYLISIPVVDNRYDLLAEKYPLFHRIQVKPLNLQYRRNPAYSTSVDQWSISAFTTPNREKRTYCKEDVDYIFGIDLEYGNYALIPIEKVPSSGQIRISERNQQTYRYFNSMEAIED